MLTKTALMRDVHQQRSKNPKALAKRQTIIRDGFDGSDPEGGPINNRKKTIKSVQL
jgi:hypothetical protein